MKERVSCLPRRHQGGVLLPGRALGAFRGRAWHGQVGGFWGPQASTSCGFIGLLHT